MSARFGAALAYGGSRLFLVLVPLGLIPYVGGDHVADDVVLYDHWAQIVASGSFPTGDPMWQYPPLAGFVFWLGHALLPHAVLGFMAVAFAADAAIFWIFWRRGTATGSLAAVWGWVAAGFAIGPVFLTRFDVLPTLCAVVALALAARPWRSGIALGLGALLKVWPAALVLAWPRRSFGRVAATTAATGAVGLSLLAAWGPGSLSFLTEQRNRGLQIESVPAVGFVVAKMLGAPVKVGYAFGCVEVDAAGVRGVALLATVIGAAMLAAIAYARFRGRIDHAPPADVALLLVLVALVTSRVLSPQFMIWVAGVGCACLLDARTRMRPVLALLLPAAVLGQWIFPGRYGDLMLAGPVAVSAQVLRVGLLVAATVLAARQVLATSDVGGGASSDQRAREPDLAAR